MLRPKLLTTLEGYSRRALTRDLTAGVIVGVVALPLCIAFAIASGMPPEKGLIAGVIGGLFVSALGGSRVQIGGPAGAFVVIVYSIVHQYGVDGLLVSTFLAGILLIVLGRLRAGSIIKFIPQPVVLGFTGGIALIIFFAQIRDLLGLEIAELPADFIEKLAVLASHLSSINSQAVWLSAGTLAVLILWPRLSRRIPASLIALVGATLAAQLFQLDVETIGSRFGNVSFTLPAPHLPSITFAMVRDLVQPAITIAVLVAVESLLSAVVADGMIGGRHRSDMELIAQGFANMGSALFGGLPVTGAIARTATNIRNGGRTPVAGIVHALVLLLIMLFFGKWAARIPLACLAAILVVVAYNMSEWRSVKAMFSNPKSDVAILLTTLTLTVVIDLTVAIEVGGIMAAVLFIKRMSAATSVEIFTSEMNADADAAEERDLLDVSAIPQGVQVYEINGPLFFGAVYKFKEAMSIVTKAPPVRILRMRKVSVIDASGLAAIEEVWRTSHKHGTVLIISGIHAQPFSAMRRSGLLEKIGPLNVQKNFEKAIGRAREVLNAGSASASA